MGQGATTYSMTSAASAALFNQLSRRQVVVHLTQTKTPLDGDSKRSAQGVRMEARQGQDARSAGGLIHDSRTRRATPMAGRLYARLVMQSDLPM